MLCNALSSRVNYATRNFIKKGIRKTSTLYGRAGASAEPQNFSFDDESLSKAQDTLKLSIYRDATTLYNYTLSRKACMVSEQEKNEYLATFPEVVRELKEYYSFKGLDDAMNYYLEMLNYNLPYGRLTTGLVFIAVYKAVQHPENLTSENLRSANIMAWCAEMVKQLWVIADDITDASDFRAGRLCWHKKQGVGLRAVNDIQILENGLHYILKKYLSGQPSYIPVLELFHTVNMETAVAQTWDTMFMVNGKPQLEMYTIDKYLTKCSHKASYSYLYLPSLFALYFSNRYDENVIRNAESIIFKLSGFFAVQNDIQDCFVDPTDSGKMGSDIREGKCTWPIVTALQRASLAQRKVLEENFGRPYPECAAAVLAVYEEIDIRSIYLSYWEENYTHLRNYIQRTCGSLPPKPFLRILDYISGQIR